MTQAEPCPDCGAASTIIVNALNGTSGAYDVICEACGFEMYVPAETTAKTRIEAIRKIVQEKSAARVDGYIVDLFTAQMLIVVYDALSDENKERFGQPRLDRLVALGWKNVKVGS